MAFWLDIAAFALKILIVVGGLGALAALIARLARADRPADPPLAVRSLDARYDAMREAIEAAALDPKAAKALRKQRRKQRKAETKAGAAATAKRVFVLGFKGDLRATAVKRLGAEIDALLTLARPNEDEVVLRIESGGGTVNGYGLAAAEVMRLTTRKIHVTASVDQVAASGGYLMAVAADRIVAAPFALIGSIGVVAQVPNVNRLLKKNAIDFEEITSGEHKRSVSIFGEITPAGREHFRGKLDSTHEAFKAFVKARRPMLDMARVGDGDVWLGSEALSLGLVDALATGDDFLFARRGEARLYEVALEARKPPLQRLFEGFGVVLRAALARLGLPA